VGRQRAVAVGLAGQLPGEKVIFFFVTSGGGGGARSARLFRPRLLFSPLKKKLKKMKPQKNENSKK